VLARNNVCCVETTGMQGASRPPLWSDPLGCEFIVPMWVKRPWDIATFYIQSVGRRYSGDGLPWFPPLGSNPQTYLRPAQDLLTHGIEFACRCIIWGLTITNHTPSLQWIAAKATEFGEQWQGNEQTSQESDGKPTLFELPVSF